MSSETARTFALPEGRSLEVHELGDPDGFPILFHRGTPGSGTMYARRGFEPSSIARPVLVVQDGAAKARRVAPHPGGS